jgi:hypothetical protein
MVNEGCGFGAVADMLCLCAACCCLQSVIGLAAFWVVLGGIVGVAGFNYVNSKQIKDSP